MRLTHTISPGREAEEDSEYGFCEETAADVMHQSLEKLQLLACELRGGGTHPQAIERVCDCVVHDPVYADSTRSIFRSTLELLRRRAR
jgi:hypothetical protein